MQSEITYKINQKDFEQVLEQKLTSIQKESLLNRYKHIFISTSAAAELLEIHRETVLKYAKAKLIPHQKNGPNYKFCLAHILDLDFQELKRIN